MSGTGTSDWLILDHTTSIFTVSIAGVFSAGANLVYTVDVTNETLSGPTDTTVVGIALDSMTALGASSIKSLVGPVVGVRIRVTSHTGGSVKLVIKQSGGHI